MKKVFLLIFTFFLCCSSSYGLSLGDLGSQITVNDGQANSTWGGGSPALGIAGEDNETEGNPNTYTYQGWDLEGIFWNTSESKLYIIGGFNYLEGGPNNHSEVNMGDIFIGNNYVLDLSRSDTGQLTATGSYNIVENYIGNTMNPTDVIASAPYAYSGIDSGQSDAGYIYSAYKLDEKEDSEIINYFEAWQTYANAPESSYSDVHYALEIDVSGIAADLINSGSLIHATLACGNDTIEGKMNPVPEPATMLLLGSGLVGLAGFGRKKFMK